MGFKSSYLLCLALFLAISSSIHAVNITKLLDRYPDFATFQKYLTEAELVGPINHRNTITVLAVSDGDMSVMSGKNPDVIKAMMSTHVILDYFDERKLMHAQATGEIMTTMYQSSGVADGRQGFVKVKLIGGKLEFGSAVKGAPMDVEFVKTVALQPYNISLLQVAKPLMFPGLDSQSPVGGAAKAPMPTPNAHPPSKSFAPAPSSEEADAPAADEVEVPTPAEAPAPAADAPSPGPTGAEDAADAASDDASSSSSRIVVGLVGAVMCFASLLVVM